MLPDIQTNFGMFERTDHTLMALNCRHAGTKTRLFYGFFLQSKRIYFETLEHLHPLVSVCEFAVSVLLFNTDVLLF